MTYWAEQYRRIPPGMLAAVTERRCHGVRFDSPALHGAVRVLAARCRVSTSTVLLTTATALLARRAGTRLGAMSVVVHNRFRPDRRRLVATLSQLGLFVLDLDPVTDLPGLVRRGWGAALLAARSACYDEAELRPLLDRVGAERGTPVNPGCCFNDLRPDGERAGAPATEAEVRAALTATRMTPMAAPLQSRCRFCLVVAGNRGIDQLQLTANAACLPAEELQAFLVELEAVVVAGAFGSIRVGDDRCAYVDTVWR
jgi:hypothetical protein